MKQVMLKKWRKTEQVLFFTRRKLRRRMMRMSANNISRVAWIFGMLEGAGRLDEGLLNEDFTSMEDEYDFWESVYQNWANEVDIQNLEERGYITPYAERIILKKYGV